VHEEHAVIASAKPLDDVWFDKQSKFYIFFHIFIQKALIILRKNLKKWRELLGKYRIDFSMNRVEHC
jgi:hypothetical protein